MAAIEIHAISCLNSYMGYPYSATYSCLCERSLTLLLLCLHQLVETKGRNLLLLCLKVCLLWSSALQQVWLC